MLIFIYKILSFTRRRVVGTAYSDGIQDLGPMRWEIVLCYLLAFILVIIALSKSIKSSGKVILQLLRGRGQVDWLQPVNSISLISIRINNKVVHVQCWRSPKEYF